MKGRRITQAKRQLVITLHDQGMNITEIALATGVPKSSVARICRTEEDRLPDEKKPLGRCPRCGRLVRLPCYACWLETAPESRKRAWRAAWRKLEKRAMDLVKEIQELKQAIQDALEDGRITLREAIVIAREAADVAAILLPLILGKTAAMEAESKEKE
ncbi:MAG: helix-turn-helix domain-containing protein [Thermogutta sp.]|uniref:helix-turn-helix domain-containing protein n=1 Tax=Thermogutta sp. TaxID=1962930 RepID=UPI0019C2F0A8|nr:helix-turn-helix domain-containing protein [Thermogutta sp.]MBC7351429.1 helix-turn-helix domain-containing protein [Thermogutta sp.]